MLELRREWNFYVGRERVALSLVMKLRLGRFRGARSEILSGQIMSVFRIGHIDETSVVDAKGLGA